MAGKKARSVRIHEFGGPEVLRLEDVLVAALGPGAAGLNNHAGSFETDDGRERRFRGRSSGSEGNLSVKPDGMNDEVGQGVSVGIAAIP
jgi:hypothetical protein